MRRHPLSPPSKTLSDQQKYLLQRLPGRYDIPERKTDPEPARVRQARLVIERWDREQRKLSCKAKCAAEQALQRAREAIYFAPVATALLRVQEAEKFKQGCDD